MLLNTSTPVQHAAAMHSSLDIHPAFLGTASPLLVQFDDDDDAPAQFTMHPSHNVRDLMRAMHITSDFAWPETSASSASSPHAASSSSPPSAKIKDARSLSDALRKFTRLCTYDVCAELHILYQYYDVPLFGLLAKIREHRSNGVGWLTQTLLEYATRSAPCVPLGWLLHWWVSPNYTNVLSSAIEYSVRVALLGRVQIAVSKCKRCCVYAWWRLELLHRLAYFNFNK